MARRSKMQFGDKLLERALRNFGESIEEKAREIIQETGVIIFSQAVSLAPVSNIDGGNLKNSISFESSMDGLSVKVISAASYSVYIEFGSGIYAEDGKGRKDPWIYFDEKLDRFVFTRGNPPQPFWFPSIDRGRAHFLREMRRLG